MKTRSSVPLFVRRTLPQIDFLLFHILGLFGFRRRYRFLYVLLLLANPTGHLTGDPVEHGDCFCPKQYTERTRENRLLLPRDRRYAIVGRRFGRTGHATRRLYIYARGRTRAKIIDDDVDDNDDNIHNRRVPRQKLDWRVPSTQCGAYVVSERNNRRRRRRRR